MFWFGFWETVLRAKALLTKSEESIASSLVSAGGIFLLFLLSFSSSTLFPSLLKGGRNRFLTKVFFKKIKYKKLFIYLNFSFDVATLMIIHKRN
jgi:hypothetical protein